MKKNIFCVKNAIYIFLVKYNVSFGMYTLIYFKLFLMRVQMRINSRQTSILKIREVNFRHLYMYIRI